MFENEIDSGTFCLLTTMLTPLKMRMIVGNLVGLLASAAITLTLAWIYSMPDTRVWKFWGLMFTIMCVGVLTSERYIQCSVPFLMRAIIISTGISAILILIEIAHGGYFAHNITLLDAAAKSAGISPIACLITLIFIALLPKYWVIELLSKNSTKENKRRQKKSQTRKSNAPESN